MATVPRLRRYYQGATTPRIASLRLIDSPASTTCRLLVRVSLARSRSPQTGSTGPGDFRFRRPHAGHYRWTIQGLPGFLAVHPVTLRRSRDPGRPLVPRPSRHCRCCPRLTNTEDTITRKYRGSIAPLHHLLCTLHDVHCCPPCNTRFRPVGCTFTGRESNPLDCDEWFPSS